MSGKVVDLGKWKEENTPHLSGRARCLQCKHEWIAVAPVGTAWLQCPKCECENGRFAAQVQRDGMHWHCKCGNDLFHITPEGSYCPMCGAETRGER